MASTSEDPHLGSGLDDDDTPSSGSASDSDSILSDDSVLPDYTQEIKNGSAASTLYQTCARNESTSLQGVLERGVTKEEVMELDINGWVRVSIIAAIFNKFDNKKMSLILSIDCKC